MSKYYLKMRKIKLFYTMTCSVCKDEIKIGDKYYAVGRGYEHCLDCAKKKELI